MALWPTEDWLASIASPLSGMHHSDGAHQQDIKQGLQSNQTHITGKFLTCAACAMLTKIEGIRMPISSLETSFHRIDEVVEHCEDPYSFFPTFVVDRDLRTTLVCFNNSPHRQMRLSVPPVLNHHPDPLCWRRVLEPFAPLSPLPS